MSFITILNFVKPINKTKTIKKLNVLESRSSPLAAMRICFSGKSWDFPIKQIHISGLRQDIKVKNRKKHITASIKVVIDFFMFFLYVPTLAESSEPQGKKLPPCEYSN